MDSVAAMRETLLANFVGILRSRAASADEVPKISVKRTSGHEERSIAERSGHVKGSGKAAAMTSENSGITFSGKSDASIA